MATRAHRMHAAPRLDRVVLGAPRSPQTGIRHRTATGMDLGGLGPPMDGLRVDIDKSKSKSASDSLNKVCECQIQAAAATSYSTEEIWSMAQDFLQSGSTSCSNTSPPYYDESEAMLDADDENDNDDDEPVTRDDAKGKDKPGGVTATTEQHQSQDETNRQRKLRYLRKCLEDDLWDIGEARPRVSSMPTRPSFLNSTTKRSEPSNSSSNSGELGDDVERVRSFAITSKGLVNRGNCYLRKSQSAGAGSRRNLAVSARSQQSLSPGPEEEDTAYKILVVGSSGVGKRTLMKAFAEESYLDDLSSFDDEVEKSVSILLDGEESTMDFIDLSDKPVDDQIREASVDAYVVVYSVEDRRSYEAAINRLLEIREAVGRQVALILVANKTDLVRSRVVTEEEGRAAAKTYDSKYIEVSAAIDLKIDELLVGVLKQIRLFKQRYERSAKSCYNGTILDSCFLLQARQNVLAKIFRGGKPTSNSCGNLYVL